MCAGREGACWLVGLALVMLGACSAEPEQEGVAAFLRSSAGGPETAAPTKLPQCGYPSAFQHTPSNAPHRTSLGEFFDGWDPDVVRDHRDGKYKIWHSLFVNPQNEGIAYAESADGNTWQVDGPGAARLVIRPTPGGWDRDGMETVSVLQEPDGSFKMWYLGYPCYRPVGEFGRHKCIGYATSPDGRQWTKWPEPVLVPELPWEQPFKRTVTENGQTFTVWEGGVQEPSVVFDDRFGVYVMFYEAYSRPKLGGKFVGLHRIGLAISADGVNWQKHNVPVFEPSMLSGETGQSWEDPKFVGHTNVVKDPSGSGFHLFYASRWSIGHAFSATGFSFSRNPQNPVVQYQTHSGGGFTFFGGPSAIIGPDRQIDLFLMRSPQGAATWGQGGMRIGRAQGVCAP